MSNIVGYSPLDELAGFGSLGSPVDELLKGFFVRPMSLGPQWGRSTPMRVEVIENENEYRVFAELPGARKEDINVSIHGGDVTISAETREEKETGQEWKTLMSERWYGKTQRSFSLENEIDEARAQARYTDGVLQLVLPKKEAATRKRLTVH
jgi:HSP20 family protein